MLYEQNQANSQRTLQLPGFGAFLKEPSLYSGDGVVSGDEHSRGGSFS